MRDEITKELNRLVNENILEPVEKGGSEWASPIVCIEKNNGQYRICGDYKIEVNNQLKSDSYLPPSIETVFATMAGTNI